MAEGTGERRLAAILSADAVGYSRLMAANEAATVQTLRSYRDLIAALVEGQRGRVVDFSGDNALCEFPSAFDAAPSGLILMLWKAPPPASRLPLMAHNGHATGTPRLPLSGA